jgi:ABC-type bacteriocin/lantibiotic exporter with double-glycine peptidase domain
VIFHPPAAVRLPVPHVQQRAHGECLAACVAMCLAYLKRPVRYERLVHVLDIKPGVGTSFSNLRRLERLQLGVTSRKQGTLEELYTLLCGGWPSIASVQTQELPYWQGVNVYHVVVVVGMDAEQIYVNDPDLPAGPVAVALGDFDLAWLAQDETYAVIAPEK